MESFLIIYRSSPAGAPEPEHVPERWSAWFATLGAHLIDRGSYAHGSIKIATRLAGPKSSASSLAGYCVVAADDFDAAAHLAEACPIFDEHGSLEVARLTAPPA